MKNYDFLEFIKYCYIKHGIWDWETIFEMQYLSQTCQFLFIILNGFNFMLDFPNRIEGSLGTLYTRGIQALLQICFSQFSFLKQNLCHENFFWNFEKN